MRLIILLIACLAFLSGCMLHRHYDETLSEVYVSPDYKKLLVTGGSKRSYELDIPDPLAAAMQSPLKEGISLLFPYPYTAFHINEDGTLQGHFNLILADSFFQEREDLIQEAKSLGFVHGRKYWMKGRIEIAKDGEGMMRYAGWTDADAEKYTTVLDSVYYLPVSMTGRKLLNGVPEDMQSADYQALDRRYTVSVVDSHNKKVSLLGPAAVVTGGAACAYALPVCIAASLPMMGLRP